MVKSILWAVALTGLLAACLPGGPGYVHSEYGPAVSVDVTHVHTDRCGHFHHEGYWYVARGHHHGPGCGHVQRDGVWYADPWTVD